MTPLRNAKRFSAMVVLLAGLAWVLASNHCAFAALETVAPAGHADEAKAPYPLTTCMVSGEKLGGDMGKPYVFTYEGQEVELCCKSCKKDFDKDPAKYMKVLEAASQASK